MANADMSLSKTIRGTALYSFAVVGIPASLMFATGLALDIRAFDRTRGGYEPPYTGYAMRVASPAPLSQRLALP